MAGVCTGNGPCDVHPTGHGGNNFVTRGGGFDPYLRAIINALKRKGHPESQAVQIAIGTVQRWARGEGNVSAETRARAAASLAHWEALKAKAHALTAEPTRTFDLAIPHYIDLAARVYRFRHGWIPLAGAAEKDKLASVTQIRDYSGGWARKHTDGRPEYWGEMQHGTTGEMVHLYRGKRNVARYYDESGKQVGPDHSNVAPAVAWAVANGYHSPELARAGIFPDRKRTKSLTAVPAATVDLAFTPSLHPRAPKGASNGGKFVAKNGGSGSGEKNVGATYRSQVADFQKRTGLPVTGKMDAATTAKVAKLRSPATGGGSSTSKAKTAAAAMATRRTATASAVNGLSPQQREAFRILRPKPPAGYHWDHNNRLVRSTPQSRRIRNILGLGK